MKWGWGVIGQLPKHPMVEVPKKVTNLEHLLYLYPPPQVSSDGILASPPPAPPPSPAQRANKRTVEGPAGPPQLAHKHRDPQAADCIQIANCQLGAN